MHVLLTVLLSLLQLKLHDLFLHSDMVEQKARVFELLRALDYVVHDGSDIFL